MLAGRAAGKMRTGLHVAGNGAPVTKIGLTVQQLLGVPLGSWGTQSMQATDAIGELLA